MKTSAILLAVTLFVGTVFHCKSSGIIPGSVNFSGCTITTHQKIGALTAKNAQLASVEATDGADLENTTTTGLLEVVGDLICKNCKLESVTKTGSGELDNTTIKNRFRSTGSTTARTCSFGGYSGCGAIHLEDTDVAQEILNTGNTTIVRTKCQSFDITGTVDAYESSCSSANITGKTTFANVTVNGSASITGKTTLSNSSAVDLTIVGRTVATHVNATTINITGGLDAKTVDCEKLTLATKESMLTDCSIDTLYVKKQKHGIKIILYNSPRTPKRRVKRIICEDPRTQIVYKDDSLRAEEIVGTQRVTPSVQAQ